MTEPLIFELSSPGRVAYSLPQLDVPVESSLPASQLRSEPDLPEIHELDVVRHFTHLSQLNYAVNSGFYPLGSCTMKYNPVINEDVAKFPGFSRIHPNQDPSTVQGALRLIYELQRSLAEISGLDAVTVQPAAGAHGELTGMLMVKAYHLKRGDLKRTKVLVPDSAHGTNPATAAMCGFEAIPVPAEPCGTIDLTALKALATEEVAALMLTNPNTLGLFEDKVCEITDIVHRAGGLVYGDGANLNAILGVVKPAHLGFDVFHFNLHKTFSTPHGGGGPGAGPVGVKNILAPYLPGPLVEKKVVEDADGRGRALEIYAPFTPPDSIGRVRSFYGNFGVLVRAYNYIRMLGPEGLREVSTNAVLAANYLKSQVVDYYDQSCDRSCMHEFVLSGARQKTSGVRTLDIAKRLIDYGFHPPTIYFPLIVEEALMIEPTETESIETLNAFAEAMRRIAREAEEDPEVLHSAPHNTPVRRLDEVAAARNPKLRWRRASS